MLFNTLYTYKIKAHYVPQSATPETTKESTLGDLECSVHADAGNFCISEAYYIQFKNYLLANFPNDFSNAKIVFLNKFQRTRFHIKIETRIMKIG